ncbi:MAG TPA: ABC transporter ATP-binding protein [Gemmatimonadales bacterium]|nr:ABC transporter ATP-binding protein [Gemmatimonadales bacterium]
MTPPMLEVRDLVVDYPGGGLRRAPLRAVAGVSFEVAAGEAFGLVGESGSGKSTIARAILRLQPVAAGRVRFEGREVTELRGEELRRLRRRMQVVFQDPGAALDPRMTAGEAVTEGLAIHRLAPRTERRARAAGLLAEVGLDPGAVGRLPEAFSGGQRQRIGIARALALEPAFLVCDEPVSALDVSVRAQVIGLLDALRRRRGLALLFISHDLAVVRQVAARTAVLYAGRIVEVGATGEILAAPRHPYTQALRSAVPVPDPAPRPGRIILAGEARRADSAAPGCPFHARCFHPARDGKCVAERPELRPVGPALVACHHAT